jgi:hypothetical protein
MLVGHSMAGIALTAVPSAPRKIGRLVYLAAFMPLPGTPMIDYVRCAENAGEEVAGLFVAPPPKIGAMRIDFRNAALHERIRSAFAHDVDATHFAAMNHLLTPDVPAGPVATPTVATRQRWGRVPRAYIRCSEDRAVMPALQDRFIREADAWTPENPTRVLTLAASHSPFLSMPESWRGRWRTSPPERSGAACGRDGQLGHRALGDADAARGLAALDAGRLDVLRHRNRLDALRDRRDRAPRTGAPRAPRPARCRRAAPCGA